jgi:predicted polyphosphate/ATP-dependent NAD kinase
MLELEPALLLFAGGDGTARDLHEVVGQRLPVLGIPAGVKMHSGVFAASARAAARVAGAYLRAEARDPMLADSEVLDRDPQDVDGASSPQLFGLLKTPYLASLSPGAKASNRFSGESAVAGALQRVVDTVRDERLSLIGPGSTMLALKRRLGLRGSPLGVDAIAGYRPVGEDLDEERILSLLCDRPARLVMGVVGGQGFLFGRGNQQLGPRVLRQIGAEHTIVVASVDKLAALSAGCLLLDTGDEQLDREFARFLPVRVSYRRTVMMPVRGASSISGG